MKRCIDCGPKTKRPAPHPGPRCYSHHQQVMKERKARQHDQRVQRVYGLGPGEYQKIYDYQEGLCAICGPTTGRKGKTKKLSVDHDHKTGEVRGLLCSSCNTFVGLVRDDAMAFLRGYKYLLDPPARAALETKDAA